MKNRLSLFFVMLTTLAVLSLAGCKSAQETVTTQLPNPMRELTDATEIAANCHSIHLPEGAEQVQTFLIGEKVFEQRFALGDIAYTVRAKSSDAYEDISGLYFTWSDQQEVEIASSCQGSTMRCRDDFNKVDIVLCTWYDASNQVTYSLEAEAPHLNDFDIIPLVNEIFRP